MKPIKLVFQAFGPYKERQEIDFEHISSKGLFLICGETGSGKTMLLDAMTFALYGKSSGKNRDDFESLRCTKADFNASTIVSFEFENNGEYYLFERRLERKRTNLSKSYNVARLDLDGKWIPLFENPKDRDLNNKAEEIIGLDYDQFRQVIVLPQGQFEKLLTSSSEEKEQILSTIFGEDKWKKIADIMVAQAEDKYKQLKEKKFSIDNSLYEEDCNSLDELSSVVTANEKDIENIREMLEKLNYDEEVEKLDEASKVLARFNDLHKYEQKLKELEAVGSKQEERKNRLELAQRAEKVRGVLANFDRLTKEVEVRQLKKKEAETVAAGAKKNASEAKATLDKHSEEKDKIDGLRKTIIEYSNKRDDYANLASLKNDFDKKIKAYNDAKENIDTLVIKQNKQAEIAAKLKNEFDILQHEHDELLKAYMSGISGILAEKLVEGSPCPVCGSTHHPNKAIITDASITENIVNSKKLSADKKYSELQNVNLGLQKINADIDEANKKLVLLGQESSSAKVKYESVISTLIAGITDSNSLERKIKELEKNINVFEEEHERLCKTEQNAREVSVTASSNVENAIKELESVIGEKTAIEADLNLAVRENQFADITEVRQALLLPDDLSRLQTEIKEYDAEVNSNGKAIKDIKKELKGIEEPNEEAIHTKKNNLLAQKDTLTKELAGLKTETDRLKKKHKDLSKKSEGLEQALLDAEEEYAFAKKLRGDTGKSLQRYVLGIMFSSVIAAANRMLELVHDGRYRLYRTDDKVSGRKSGLELKVTDKYSDSEEGRFVNTLSGGEKFLVSLALSIGMSTVAQKSGIKIEALFIDEGFGSLDENSIEDAMNVLETIQRANGMVGIISHVQILRSRIPQKLQVNKSEGSSTISMSIG